MPSPKDLIKKKIWKKRLSKAHKGLIPWNKGKSLSEKTKRKLSKVMKEFWNNTKYRKKMEVRNKKLSELMRGYRNPMKRPEVVKKRSEKMKGKLVGNKNPAKRPEIRRKISKALKGHLVSQETRKKIKRTLKGKYVGKKNPFYGKHHTKEVREKSRIRAIKQLISGELKNRPTSIELRIEKELIKNNIYYKKQVSLKDITVVDFYLPRREVAIYCDGIFWHKSEWAKKRGVIEKDRKQVKILSANGYKVFRLSETEINSSPKRCVEKIVKYINKV
jgi:very-short-patch-repair endonuclease